MFDRTDWAQFAEAAISVVGLVLLWQHALSARGRERWKVRALPEWSVTVTDFFTFLFFVLAFWFLGGVLGLLGTRPFTMTDDARVILQSTTSEFGMLAGVVIYALLHPGRFALTKLEVSKSLRSGVVTYFIAAPIVFAAGAVWTTLLKVCGLPVEKQPAIELFTRTKSPGWLGVLVLLAIVLAPMAEELIFRAGFFRYCRTRLPRWLAFVGPACLFAALHQNLASFGQLVALAIVFSYAYERTGQIGTSMVAHGLFNLNTVVLLLLGINL
ncbi:MAG TPA: CPBP family intramembrane glutamic endopeptidase [Opitutaceae bacterium]|nr:CPBP family intramembrane glutamic endopeptidase [Opitutaceae bacterium]